MVKWKSPDARRGETDSIWRRLAYRAESKRDLRLDWMRGAAVFVMVADHLGGPSWLRVVTGGNEFIVSAAEFFVLISGWVGGMVWGAFVEAKGIGAGAWKILRRAAVLYVAMVAVTIGFGSFAIYFHLPWANDIADVAWETWTRNTMLLRQTMPFADILLLYTVLLFAAPIALIFLRLRGALLLVIGSSLLWWWFQATKIEIPWEIPGYGFHIAAWQLLFFVGMAIGYHHTALARILGRVPALIWPVVAIGLFLGLDTAYSNALATIPNGERIVATDMFFKSTLAPGRLFAFALMLPLVFLIVHLLWKPLAWLTGWLILPLGQKALFSYVAHVVLVGLCSVFVPAEWNASWDTSGILQAIAVLMIWAMIRLQIVFVSATRVAATKKSRPEISGA